MRQRRMVVRSGLAAAGVEQALAVAFEILDNLCRWITNAFSPGLVSVSVGVSGEAVFVVVLQQLGIDRVDGPGFDLDGET